MRLAPWLLPGLAVCVLAGVVAADRFEPSPRAALVVALACGATASAFRRRAGVCAGCAFGAALALGGYGLASDLAAAKRQAPDATRDRAVEARVCETREAPGWRVVELCGLREVAFGSVPHPGLEARSGHADRGSGVPARVQLIEAAGTPEGDWLASLVTGDRVRARLRIAPLRSLANPGLPDRTRPLARRGVAARARLLDARVAVRLAPDGSPTLAAHARALRRATAARLQARGPGGGLLAALALGDRSGLSPGDRDAFRRLGIAHLLAVSGLHVALVASLAWMAAFGTLRRLSPLTARWDVRLPALGVACGFALAYALATGWGTPVRRAWVFLLCSAGGMALRRTRARWHGLSAAALMVATLEPAAVFEPGAQLSFVAAAALVASGGAFAPGARAGERGLARLVRAGRASLHLSATALAATAPVLALHGLSGTPAGLVANVVAVPVTAFVLLPAALLAASAALLAGDAAGGLVGGPARLAGVLLAAADHAASWLPTASRSGPPPVAWALVLAGALAVGVVRARRTRTRAVLVLAVCGVLSLAPAVVVGPSPPRVVVFDVGQGDAILVQGRDAAVLVDGGGALPGGADLGARAVVPALRALGVHRLDVVVATHADLDHRGGLPSVLRDVSVGELWLPRDTAGEFEALVAAAHRAGIPVRERSRGDPAVRLGDLRLETLWPPPAALQPAASRNDRSLVSRVELAGIRVLLPGDISHRVEEALVDVGADLRASLVVLPHHGSAGSSSRGFLRAVGAGVALVSAPCSGRSRLPTAEALERARDSGMSVWWTGRDGALLVPIRQIRGDMATISVWGWRRAASCPDLRPVPFDRAALGW